MAKSVSFMLNDAEDVLHLIRAKLYPNRLPKGEGTYIARISNERVLSVREICDILKTRGGFSGDQALLLDHVQRFFNEAAYQLCNGFAVDMGLFKLSPSIGGIFLSPRDKRDREKHPLEFHLHAGSKLKELAKIVDVVIDGVANTRGYIHQFIDVDTGSVNSTLSGGGSFIITGSKIKVAGDDPMCGVYLEPEGDPDARVKVQTRFAVNSPSKIIGTVPMLAASQSYRLLIITQFLGSGNTFLQKPKTLSSEFVLKAG